MNRLSKSLLGGALVLLLMIISACSGNSTQQPSSMDNGTTEQSTPATPSTEGSTDQPATGTEPATNTDGTSSSTEGSTETADNGGKETVPAAKPELTPANEGQVDITIVQQGPGQFFVRLNEFPEGYLVSNLDWTGPGYSEAATFDEAVKNGQEGNNGFYASSDHRNFGFIYDGHIAGEEGKFTLTFRNQAGDELTWYKDLTLQ
ncbi:hypothetical protein PO903_15780 [Paenibacillus sp. PK4536]|uniref:DUF4352 domain-containing protein n=1 Tax=Paenibacillus nuruki TaxID=1886670 RepID=A0A1E3L1X3_9BACL|nr:MULTISPECIES: hypothetical protein [Paenibacillus]ODP27799.1 hypothetical protein PTI45_02822 [Paenibacillus nuruki]TKJ89453.1 hypothetical protein PaeCFBP13512_15110 [Paenibacillus sp. CFBP13512]WIM38105.1 hypothetical protein PO903_15780 [Paenibacillus sp. PK4536]CAJ1315227.1 Lipoprotein [Paenibacillus nuruki]